MFAIPLLIGLPRSGKRCDTASGHGNLVAASGRSRPGAQGSACRSSRESSPIRADATRKPVF